MVKMKNYCVPVEDLGPFMVCSQLLVLSNISCGNKHLWLKLLYSIVENMPRPILCSASCSCFKISWRPDAHHRTTCCNVGPTIAFGIYVVQCMETKVRTAGLINRKYRIWLIFYMV